MRANRHHSYWWHLRNAAREDWQHGTLRADLARAAILLAIGLAIWWVTQ